MKDVTTKEPKNSPDQRFEEAEKNPQGKNTWDELRLEILDSLERNRSQKEQ